MESVINIMSLQPTQLLRFSDQEFPVLHVVQTDSGAHPASDIMSMEPGDLFRSKLAGA
jgi:hypothetical protein